MMRSCSLFLLLLLVYLSAPIRSSAAENVLASGTAGASMAFAPTPLRLLPVAAVQPLQT